MVAVLAVQSQPVLSLQFGEMQGDFAKLQGQRRLIPAEGPRLSMGWLGLSLVQGAGRPSFHSREGRFRHTAPVFVRGHSRSLVQCPLSGLLSDIDPSLDEFPAIGTGNFLLQTGKGIAPNSELRMSACRCKSGHRGRTSARPLMTHSGHGAVQQRKRPDDAEVKARVTNVFSTNGSKIARLSDEAPSGGHRGCESQSSERGWRHADRLRFAICFIKLSPAAALRAAQFQLP